MTPMPRSFRLFASSLSLLISLALGACQGGTLSTARDGGAEDSGASDGSVVDSGVVDASPSDSALPDSSAMDSSLPDSSPDAPPPGPVSGYVDPSCIDGMYSEPLPNLSADIDSIPFVSIRQFVDDVLGARYPAGQFLVRGGLTNESIQNCDELFANGASREGVFDSLGTIVHECGHIYDFVLSSGGTDGFAVTEALTLTGDDGDTVDRFGRTFARSYLNSDEFAVPECVGGSDSSCDFYRNVYLDGDPTNGTFEGGDQGFNSVVEEAYQYVNSLAVAWTYLDQRPPGFATSARDGILTFLWYVGRYLRIARTRTAEFPGVYDFISGSPVWREIILTLWGRAWIYIEATEGMESLAISGDTTFMRATNPAVLDEINRIRLAEGCAGVTPPAASSRRFRAPAHLIRQRLEAPCAHDHLLEDLRANTIHD